MLRRTLCTRTLQPSKMPMNASWHCSTLLRAKTRWVCSTATMQKSLPRLRNRSAGAMSTARNTSINQMRLPREQCVQHQRALDVTFCRPVYLMCTGHKLLNTPAPRLTFLIPKGLSTLLGIRDSEKASKESSYRLDVGSITGLDPRPKEKIVLGSNPHLSLVYLLGTTFSPE